MNRVVLATLLLVLTSSSQAWIVQVEIPATEGSHSFDLGGPIDEIVSVTFHMQGEALENYYECSGSGPGGPWDYEYWMGPMFWAELGDGSGVELTHETYIVSGIFDYSAVFSTGSGYDPTIFLSDGTGTLTIDMFMNLPYPESDECSLAEPGFVNFSAPFLLTVEYSGSVLDEAPAWGAVKRIYR